MTRLEFDENEPNKKTNFRFRQSLDDINPLFRQNVKH